MTNPRSSSGSTTAHPVETLWREVGLPEYFLGNGGTNAKLYELYDRIRGLAQRPLDREQWAALLYVTRCPHRTWITAGLDETAHAYRQADVVLSLVSSTDQPPPKPAERWEVGKNGWDASDEATREDI
jgi:hypothetical protein